jgi:hypothetical protein
LRTQTALKQIGTQKENAPSANIVTQTQNPIFIQRLKKENP